MVTPNVEDLASSFESLVEDRDITGAAVISLAGATGGVIAQQVTNRVLPAIGMQARPTDATGLAASGVTKVLVGALHGYLGLEVGGTAGLALVVAGLGAVVIGGGDLISSGLTIFGNGGVTAGLRANNTGGSRRVRARSRNVSRSTSTSRSSSSGSSPSSNGATAASAGL